MIVKYCCFLIFVSLALFSCSYSTKIYHHNTSSVDGGEIFGSSLFVFFEKNDRVEIKKVRSSELDKELQRILSLFEKDSTAREVNTKVSLYLSEILSADKEPDDYFYNYAFVVNEKDTLYSNGHHTFQTWRYKNKIKEIENEVFSLINNR